MEKNQLVRGIFRLLRPTHFIKNLFVFLPLFFSGQFAHGELVLHAFLAFVGFCLIASSVYVFNDINDVEDDRIHPENKTRPIAAGIISLPLAFSLDLGLSLGGFILAWLVSYKLLLVLLVYKAINILYTLGLKKIAILDVMVLSLGFVLRLVAGSVSTGVELSAWIILMTFLLSLLIGLGKRRNDVVFFEQENIVLRHVVKGYSSAFLNYSMVTLAAVIIVAYLMYTLSPEIRVRMGTDYLFITVFWVIAGILRYLQLLFLFQVKVNPVVLLWKDTPLKIVLLAWVLHFMYFLY